MRKDISISLAKHDDGKILWDYLAIAAHEPNAAAARLVPLVASQLNGWKLESDFGFIATQEDEPIGAVWARQSSDVLLTTLGFGGQLSEITIAVNDASRGEGVGKALLDAIIAEARIRKVTLCLYVRDTNPAITLYEQVGFKKAPRLEITNREGGISFGMVLR